MEGNRRKRSLGEIALGFFLLTHPLPVLFHTIAVTSFALLAAWPHPVWNVLLLVIAAHMAMQISIAILNDYCDRHIDAVSKKTKPLLLGFVLPHEALIAGLLFSGLMLLLLLPLNPLALLISLLYLAFGQGYNLGLKATPLSGIVFALAIPLIPVYAFVGVGRVLPFIFWLIPIGALLGICLNLANSLPDIEDDAAQQARTLAVTLGVQGTFFACPLLLLACILLITMLSITQLVPATLWLLVPTVMCSSLLLVSMLLCSGPQKPINTRKMYFYFVVLSCLVLFGGWLTSVVFF